MGKKKNKFTDKSNIRLGFEVECVIDMPRMPANANNDTIPGYAARVHYFENNRKRNVEFRKEIFALKKRIQIGHDGSINRLGFCSYALTAELRTPPLPPKSAMELLEKVLQIVNKYGGTNASCGFHVNISSKNKSEMMRFNPITFSSSKIWKELLSAFKRKSNNYCRPTFSFNRNTSKVAIIHQLARRMTDKYHCVNFSNFGNGKAKRSRIEIRGMGNVNYSKKYHKIADYVYRIQRLFKLSCNDTNLSRVFAV